MTPTVAEFGHPDRPLQDPAADSLGRVGFAGRIARQLCGWKGRESLVVSISGDCGSGKTTLKNFIRHAIEQAGSGDRPATVVVEFNPWEWSGQDRLPGAFFAQIAEQLRAATAQPALANIADLWQRLGAALTAEPPAGATAMTAREIRRAIGTELSALPYPLIVFIDDVDRLAPAQIRLLMQLVKANVNFPQLACGLVFQRSIVVDALGVGAGGAEPAGEYLRKIVQLEIELPEAPEGLLRQQLEHGLEEILAPVSFPPRPRERWNDTFSAAVWPLFSTPRDVKRFLSAFAFQFAGFFRGSERVLEVNPIDLVLVETLRMFAHPVYLELRDTFRRRETRLVRLMSGREEERKEARLEIDGVVEQAALPPRKKRAIAAALQQLLPPGTGGSHGGRDDWDRDLRLCSPRHVERYFHLGAIADAVPAYRLIELVRATDDRGAMEALLLKAAEERILPEVLERLPALLHGLAENQITMASVSFCGICDQIPPHAPEDMEARLVRFASELFSQIKNPLKRENVIDALLDDPVRLTGPILFLQSLRPRSDAAASAGGASLSIEQFRRLIKPAAAKLQASALSGAIWRSREAGALIRRWWEWSGDKEEVQHWLVNGVKEPEHARAWLRSFLSPSPTSPAKEMVLQLEELRQFCDPAPVAIAANQACGDAVDRAAAKRLGQVLASKGTSAGFALRTITVPLEVEGG